MQTRSALPAALLALAAASAAHAQPCEPAWQPGFGYPGLNGVVYSSAVFDDGRGPAVYVGGAFTIAGNTVVNHIARWTTDHWEPLGEGLRVTSGGGQVAVCMTTFDDGSGPALFVAGQFDRAGVIPVGRIAKWDGHNWSALDGGVSRPAGAFVTAMCAFDDGSGGGPALFVAGSFLTAGATPAVNVARSRTAGWSTAGTTSNSQLFYALAPFDDHTGAGPALFAGTIHDPPVGSHIIQALFRWDGAAWSPVPGAVADERFLSLTPGVRTLRAWDAGDGERLYIGGEFAAFGGALGNGIVRWDGAVFEPISPFGGAVARDIEIASVDGEPSLFVGGYFHPASPGAVTGAVVRYDGHWFSTGPGLNGLDVYALSVSPSARGSSDELTAAGAGGIAPNIAVALGEFHGDHWEYLPIEDPGLGLSGPVNAMAMWDDGFGPSLYVGGAFGNLPVPPSPGIARFDGAAWIPFGGGIDREVNALLPVHDAAGPALILGGFLNASATIRGVARWDGVTLTPMGAVTDTGRFEENVYALAARGEGALLELFASGWYATRVPQYHFPEARVARWTGSQWAPLGPIFDLPPVALAFHDGDLYAGGPFQLLNNQTLNFLARWDGAAWSSAAAFNNRVTALFEFDDGAGPALYVGGGFTRINNIPFNRIARLRNGQWENIGDFFAGPASFAVIDSGHGPRLHACGNVLVVQGVTAANIAEWDGAAWQPVAATTDGEIRAISTFEDTATGRRSILAGGSFTHAGGVLSANFARFDPCQLSCPGDADHNGVIDFLDLNILLDHYGQPSPPGTFDPADFNLDGVVDFLDLNELLSDYGGVCNS